MMEKISLTLPTVPDLTLRLCRASLTFYNDYAGRSVFSAKAIAQIGFDLCESIRNAMNDGTEECFKSLTGIVICHERITSSKYAPVEAKVFGIINESSAIYSLGVLLRDLLISTGHSDLRLRSILDRACDKYEFGRHRSFRELQEDFAIYLKSNVSEEVYGVIITERPSPVTARAAAIEQRDEPECFKPYSRADIIKHEILKRLTFRRVQVILAVIFILFSSISIPITSANKRADLPTMASTQKEK